jgi:pilus assembly protein CpaB
VLLALALACGGLAASEVENRARSAQSGVGPLVPVVVSRADLQAGARLRPAQLDRLLTVRQIPQRYAPRDSLAAVGAAAGRRLAVTLAAGGYLTEATLDEGAGAGRGSSPGAGQRAIDVAVAAGADLGSAGPGARVDVLVTTDRGEARGRSYLALEDVELLAARPADSGPGVGGAGAGAASHASTVATLRVTLRQAVFLTAAQSFAREIRLLVRPPGERRAAHGTVVDSGSL